jgi:protease I
MADDLKGMKVAILATDGVERIELERPWGALYGAGAPSDLLSIHSGEVQARKWTDPRLAGAGRDGPGICRSGPA